MVQIKKHLKREKRHRRLRAQIKGTKECPRLCVFRSNKYIYAQLIDDEAGKTLCSVTDNTSGTKSKNKQLTKIKSALEVGKLLAEKALKKKIKKVVFDRGGYRYHGRVKAVAEGARQGGLKF